MGIQHENRPKKKRGIIKEMVQIMDENERKEDMKGHFASVRHDVDRPTSTCA
jgi:hypothetical protein